MATNESAPVADKSGVMEEDRRDSLKEGVAEASEEGSIGAADRAYRKLVHRVDRRLIVTTGFMYSVSLVDRTNIGAANIAGMGKDLGLDQGYRYVSCLCFAVFPEELYRDLYLGAS